MRGEYLNKWSGLRCLPDFLKKPSLVHMVKNSDALIVTRDDYVFKIKNYGRITKKMSALCGQIIKSFAYSKSFLAFAALSQDGRLFMWGDNEGGKLGDGSTKSNPIPKLVQGELTNTKVVQVDCSSSYTLALTDQGEFFFWGDLGHGDIAFWPDKVKGAIDNRKAVAVACTRTTTHVLLEDGQLYGWGRMYDQLRKDHITSQYDPVRVHDLIGKRMKQVVCGNYHCLALTESGQVFLWGNDHVCGNRSWDRSQPVQEAIQFGEAVQIAAFDHMSAVEFADGKVRAWDSNLYPSNITERIWLEHSSIDEAFAPYRMCRTLVVDRTVPAGPTLDDRETANFCFQVGNRQIWAHKQFLAQSLPYFHIMFHPHWEATTKTDSTIQYSYGAFKAFLNYIYTEEFGDSEEERPSIDLQELCVLADYYGHLDVIKLCKAYLSEGEVDLISM